MVSTRAEDKEDSPAFELDAQPSGFASLQKLLKGFCGLKQQQWETPEEEFQNRETTEDVVPNLKSALPDELTINAPQMEPCNETNATSSSSGDDSFDPTIPTESKAPETKIDGVQASLDEGGSEGAEVSVDKGANEVTARSLDIHEEDVAVVDYKQKSSNSCALMVITVFALLAAAVAFVTVKHLDGDFQLDFSAQGMEKLGLQVHNAIETELVHATQQMINLSELVQDMANTPQQQEADNKKTDTVQESIPEPVGEAESDLADVVEEKVGNEEEEKEEEEEAVAEEKVTESEEIVTDVYSEEESFENKEKETDELLVDLDDLTAETLTKVERETLTEVDSEENVGLKDPVEAGPGSAERGEVPLAFVKKLNHLKIEGQDES